MSQENIEAVRAVYERRAEGDFRAGAELLDPHVTMVHSPDLDVGSCYGIEALAEYTREMLKPWARLTQEAEEILQAGDTVLVGIRQRGMGSASGAPAEIRFFMLWTFRGRKVVRMESFRERAEALEAAGLSK